MYALVNVSGVLYIGAGVTLNRPNIPDAHDQLVDKPSTKMTWDTVESITQFSCTKLVLA